MKIKRMIFLFLLLFLTIGIVNANENITDDVTSETDFVIDDVVSVNDDAFDDAVNLENNDELGCVDENEVLESAADLDDASVELYDTYYEYKGNGYEIPTIIHKEVSSSNAKYYLNLVMYDKNNNVVFNMTKDVKWGVSYSDMPSFHVNLKGGNHYNAVFTMKMVSSLYGTHTKTFNYKIYLESKEENDADMYGFDDEDSIAEAIKIKAPSVTVKLKAKKYFKITIKEKNGYPVKYEDVIVKIWTGKKVKKYTLVTNSKGIVKINTKKLKLGKHKVKIYFRGTDYYKSKTVYSKIIVKKKIASAKKTSKKSNLKSVIIKIKSPNSYFATKKLRTGDRLQTIYSKGGQYSKGVYAEVSSYDNPIHTKIKKVKFYFKSNGKIKTKMVKKVSNSKYSSIVKTKLINGYIPYKAKVWYVKR